MLKKLKKAQEEMIGFALIIIIVAVIIAFYFFAEGKIQSFSENLTGARHQVAQIMTMPP